MTYIQTYHGVTQCLILQFFRLKKSNFIDFSLDLDKGIRHALHYIILNCTFEKSMRKVVGFFCHLDLMTYL